MPGFRIGADEQELPVLREFPDSWPWPRVDCMNARLKKAEMKIAALEESLVALTARVTALESADGGGE